MLNLASDIWKRLFRPRSRRYQTIIPKIDIVMDINLFKLCSGLKVLGYFMILLVAAIIAISYSAVVVLTCGPQFLRGGVHSFLAFSIIIIFHVLLVMLIWSYVMVVFWDPGSVPENWRPMLSDENLEAGSFSISSNNVGNEASGSMQSFSDGLDEVALGGFCEPCQNGKPPRCHHCSVCQRCVLKMDHHFVWVVNCVGAHNYKSFLLFLQWILWSCCLVLSSFLNHSSSPSNLATIFLAFVLNMAFALSLLCFVVMHVSLVSSNTTSIEVYEKKKTIRWKYDLGMKKNFEQVFGSKKALWFFPLLSKEDLDNIPALHGVAFPTRADA